MGGLYRGQRCRVGTAPMNWTAMIPAHRPHLKHWPRRLPLELTVPETSLWFNLEVSAARYPRKPVTWFLGRPMTYAELEAQAEALAGCPRRSGCVPC